MAFSVGTEVEHENGSFLKRIIFELKLCPCDMQIECENKEKVFKNCYFIIQFLLILLIEICVSY